MAATDTEKAADSVEGGEEQKPKLTLDVKVAEPSACQRHITVTIPRDDVERYFGEAFDKLMPDAQVPGFRSGRAPRKLVEKSFRKQIADQVKGSLLMDSMTQVSTECNFSAISEPDFDFDAIDLPEEGPMTFEFDLEVRPDFKLPEWKGLKIDKPTKAFSEGDVDKHLVNLLDRHAALEPFEGAAEEDDYVVCRITFRHNGNTVSTADEQTIRIRPTLTFSDGRLNGFEKLMEGAKAGEKRTGKISVSHSSLNPELREKEVEAEFEVLEVKRAKLPEQNQEFLDRLGPGTTTEMLRQYAKADLERQLEYAQQRRVRKQITSLLTESATWDLPPEMLKRQSRRELERAAMELQSAGFNADQIRAQLNELRQNISAWTATSLKEHFILERIAEEEKVDAANEDYDHEVALIAQQEQESPRRVRARLEKRGLMDALRNQIIERKVIRLITDQAQFKEVKFTADANETSAVEFAIGGEEKEIPEAKHGGEAAALPQSNQRV